MRSHDYQKTFLKKHFPQELKRVQAATREEKDFEEFLSYPSMVERANKQMEELSLELLAIEVVKFKLENSFSLINSTE